MPDSSNVSWIGPGGSDWQFANPGDSIMSDCKNWYSLTEFLYNVLILVIRFIYICMIKLIFIYKKTQVFYFPLFCCFVIFLTSCQYM